MSINQEFYNDFYKELDSLPTDMQVEVMHYMQFLKSRFAKNSDCTAKDDAHAKAEAFSVSSDAYSVTDTAKTELVAEPHSQAWLVGQDLFGCHQGAADLSEKAKQMAAQNIKAKYAQRTA